MLDKVIAQIRDALPSRSALAAILGSFALGFVVSTGGISCKSVPDHSVPSAPLSTKGLINLGKSYTVNLGKVYASAWETGAATIEAGQPVSSALDSVKAAWERDRVQLFNKFVSIEFDKIVPQGKSESEITTAERSALAKAWRDFAVGLRQ